MMKKDAPRGTRTGFTTGACSAAAARAATLGLVTGEVPALIECLLPNGDLVTFTVVDGAVRGDTAHAMTHKKTTPTLVGILIPQIQSHPRRLAP